MDAEAEVQDGEPDGDVQQAEADDGEAHDGAGGEGYVKTTVQALAGGLGGTRVGARGDLHPDEAGQHGPDSASQEGEGGELGEHLASGCEGHDQQDQKDHCEHLGHSGVLTL